LGGEAPAVMTIPAHTIEPPRAGASWRELLLVGLAMCAVVACIPLINAEVMLTKRFWLDEQCCTLYPLGRDPSLVQLFRNVSNADVAPPLLHVILWLLAKVTGSLSPLVVRSVALASTAAALFVLYALLRRRFSVTSCVLAVAVVSGHALVIHHAFDGRFYGPWLFFAASYLWALGLDAGQPSRRRDVIIAIVSICLCSLQWFGVNSLGLMAMGAIAAHGRRWKVGLRLVAPSVAGIVVLAALIPMMLHQLSLGGEDLLWVPPLNMGQVKQFVMAFVLRVPVLLAVVMLLIDYLRGEKRRVRALPVLRDPVMAAILATSLMTPVLMFISATMGPVMVPRYAIVSVLFVAPFVALAAETVNRWLRVAVTVVALLLFAQGVSRALRGSRHFQFVMDTYAALVDRLKSENVPLVFQTYFIMYPVDGLSRERSVIRLLELPDSTINALLPLPEQLESRKKIFLDRNQARLHNKLFGFPIPITQAQLDTTQKFYVMARDLDLTGRLNNVVAVGRVLFPRHRGERVHEYVTMFTRVSSRTQ
jgi:hypothetical protein